MNPGWLKLTSQTGDGVVYLWASDVEVVQQMGFGTLVYVHHGSVQVSESAEDVIAAVDAIVAAAEALEDGKGKTDG